MLPTLSTATKRARLNGHGDGHGRGQQSRTHRRRLVCELLENRHLMAGDFEIVEDINLKNNLLSLPSNVLSLGSIGVFTASTPDTGNELYRTDGTDAGTFLLQDIDPGKNGTQFSNDVSFVRSGTHFIQPDCMNS
jgi:ELWxxDGT repeat protein